MVQRQHVRVYALMNGFHRSSAGLGVSRLTITKAGSETNSAGKIASRSSQAAGRTVECPCSSASCCRFQKTVTNVPERIEATAPAAVARFEKNVASTTGVMAAE